MTNKAMVSLLPTEAVEALYACYAKKGDKIEVIPDPLVPGTFAVRVIRKHPWFEEEIVDLLWNKGDYDECEFTTWPPTVGDLKFF